jgi:hypothetical protein
MRVITVFFCVVFSLFAAQAVLADVPRNAPDSAPKFLTDRVERFRAVQPVRQLTTEYDEAPGLPAGAITSTAARIYSGPTGTFDVRLFTTESESAAYATLTGLRKLINKPVAESIGKPTYGSAEELLLAKGRLFVHIVATRSKDEKSLLEFADVFANTLPRGEEDIPVLVKHLPRWDSEPREVTYFVRLQNLKTSLPSAVFDSLSFDGSEAVLTKYGEAQFVIVEFPTPQLATQNDQQIVAKLQEMRNQGQPLPTLYRRVGNYAVFVFGAPDEATAKSLADEVKYEQVTKWLGDNPYPILEAQRRYTMTTLGVLVSVVKASGIALVSCLTAGFLFGGLLFLKRRSQQKTVEAYSDAGGMLRLNLDEMTPQSDVTRLLGK